MKLLETIGLVQFFLYEREDLQIGRNTAFLGPNGTGKTALLDALQTVMLAADSNRTHFNASGEGKKRARGLRDYCLGVYGQTSEARCRDAANTYINLVFRDEQTGVPVTAGVSLSASADSPEIVFNSLYLLPGVALTTEAHLQRENGRSVVLPWRSFQHVAADLCRRHGDGTAPFFTSNREEFTRRLLIEHLAAPGDKPNVQALRSAFARSLKLNQDVTDLSETLRQHLIEPRPTNVREFRARLDQFREVRDLIKRLKERIERAGATIDKYAIVQRERGNEANLDALAAVYRTERLGETLSDAEVAIETLETDVQAASLELDRASTEAKLADAARDRAIAALNRSPEYQKQAGQAERLGDLEKDLQRGDAQLQDSFKAMTAAVAAAGRLPGMESQRGDFEDALRQIDAITVAIEAAIGPARNGGASPPPVAIRSALQAVAGTHEIVRRALNEAETDEKAARARKREAELARERIGRGLAALRPDVLKLQRVLSDAGIRVTPVCDLVRIAEPRWQGALEAYLGPHVDALLVHEREVDAIDLYRGLKGDDRVYKVKLALPSRLRDWKSPGDGRFAAQLIVGEDRDAVRYLQGELGRCKLAQTSAELRAGDRALTAEGMVASGGGVERLRLSGPDELKIGRSDNAAMRAKAEQDRQHSEESHRAAEAAASRLRAALMQLAPFANAEATQASVEEALLVAANAAAAVDELQAMLTANRSKGLAGLQQAKTDADQRAIAARRSETEAGKASATLTERLKNARHQFEGLQQQLQLAGQEEKNTRLHPLYDANAVERHRTRFDERHDEDWAAKLEACRSAAQRARATAENADKEAWSLFTRYVSDYHLKNHDIASEQWMRAFEYMLADRKRLQEMELAEQEAKSEQAYEAAVKVFRTDVAQALLAGFERIDEQMDGLNKVLKAAPAFSNNERYQFRCKPLDQHRPLYDFLRRVRELGTGEEVDIFGGAGRLPEEFRALVEGDGDSELLSDTSPLNDHRRFFGYDVEIFQEGRSIGWLSKRLGPGSGGEHRTPLYVIFGAALAAAYGKHNRNSWGGGIMLLDEAFEKMDPQNVRATAEYLNALGLQLIMAGPETDQPKMSSFLDVYYDMARFGSRTIQMTKNVIMDKARELLQSDNYLAHPELLAAEIERFAAAETQAQDVAAHVAG